MSTIKLTSDAEKYAESAEQLSAFSGLKLLHVKRSIASILNLIGRNEIFDEYTKHNISHIDFMLQSLDWIIPDQTKKELTSAEWLMITLSIYFHDLGMLVTKEEFKGREKSYFSVFKNEILGNKYGQSFKDKILSLEKDDQDRFIYQELVRKTHAERIKYWILEENNPQFSDGLEIINEIKKLIIPLDDMFKRDLALICESHHLSDLDNFDKYKPDQQYGPNNQEVVNLHYCALVLRTADLLHITSDRTPSIEFNLINPTDPISQEEWAKQRSVKVVRPRKNINDIETNEIVIDTDTCEVIALFQKEDGFFGLISYLNYATKQLKENYKLNELCNKKYNTTYQYPWKNIDDSKIETKNFEKKQFEFILDQTKILNLLIGHTLYNDSSVVLRELTQNAIDASKLKNYEYQQSKKNSYVPHIKIEWDASTRVLSFIDNGTGMSLEIIENHLLKVGSSRYQDESFKKNYPDFSPISRFGIGLLTCFLIADDIDITTKTEEIEKAIQLKIRKVHGKYLLKYLDKKELPYHIQGHGTQINLFVRPDVNLDDIEKELKKWILFPDCKIEFINKNESLDAITIGYESPKSFLIEELESLNINIDDQKFKIKEVTKNGVTMAFAVRYIDHWKEWDFLENRYNLSQFKIPSGTCIEGIRVEFSTPGFTTNNFFCISNSSGKNAPKTNVARSNIETTSEREKFLATVYNIYFEHIAEELKNLIKNNSMTWAIREANYLLSHFLENAFDYNSNRKTIKIEDSKILENVLMNQDFLLIEHNKARKITNINNLISLKQFWTIDSASYESANSLVKEVKTSNTTAIALMETIYGESDAKIDHIENLLCVERYSNKVNQLIYKHFEVNKIIIVPEQRRVDFKWEISTDNIWKKYTIIADHSYNNIVEHLYVQVGNIEIDNQKDYMAISSNSAFYLLRGSDLHSYVLELDKNLEEQTRDKNNIIANLLSTIVKNFVNSEIKEDHINHVFDGNNNNNRKALRNFQEYIDLEELKTLLLTSTLKIFDTTIWNRRHYF
ncbi:MULTISPECIES: HD domain-containing protein [Sphingobacterium]|uniref:HD domain-containing protein n=1 Tax=Sphingobacterium TaxID=28453 RepID=UPI0025799050|nr:MULTISPECIES: ATP-binding protein [Sphingobacterium]